MHNNKSGYMNRGVASPFFIAKTSITLSRAHYRNRTETEPSLLSFLSEQILFLFLSLLGVVTL